MAANFSSLGTVVAPPLGKLALQTDDQSFDERWLVLHEKEVTCSAMRKLLVGTGMRK